MSAPPQEEHATEPEAPYRVERLPRDLDRKQFACGRDPLDTYFHQQVGQDVDRGYCACFIAIHVESGQIAGYYTLAPYSVAVNEVPLSLARRLPRYNSVPCVLMGRLAVATDHKGQGLGAALLVDAWGRARGNEIGGFALIVDAKDEEAKVFYERYGFCQCEPGSLRLFLSLRKGTGPAKT